MPLAYNRRTKQWSKPPLGSRIDWSHPLAAGLVCAFPLNEGGGNTAFDAVNRAVLALSGGATWGGGYLQTVGSGAVAAMVTPLALQLQPPLTLVWEGMFVAAPPGYAGTFGVTVNNSNSAPYTSYTLQTDSTGDYYAYYTSVAGTIEDFDSTPLGVSVGKRTQLVASVCRNISGQGMLVTLWVNGIYINFFATPNNNGAISYSSTSQLAFGKAPGSSVASESYSTYGYIYNRALDGQNSSNPGEIPWLWDEPYAFWELPPSTRYVFSSPTPTPTPTPTATVLDPSYITRARATTAVAGGTGTTVVSTRAGRLVQLLITATGTGSGAGVALYDSSSVASGTAVGYVPPNAAAGSIYVFDMPVAFGVVSSGVTNGPAFTVAWR